MAKEKKKEEDKLEEIEKVLESHEAAIKEIHEITERLNEHFRTILREK